jgi:pimeloyl-ACP methyl ester carboxylesterase
LPGIDKELAKDHLVISMDLPGHGLSDKPETDDAYGQQMVEDIVMIMDEQKIAKAHIVGYSMGGMIAGRMMATHPDRISSCILGGMGWLKDGSGLQKFWEIAGADRKDTAAKDAPRRGGLFYVPPACIRGIAKLAITEDQLKAINLPAEILVGDTDPMKQLYVDPLVKVRQDWPVVLIKDAGHLDCIIKTQFKDEIVKWVDGHKAK